MGVNRHKTDFRHTYVYTYNVGTLANVDKLNYKDFLGCKFELIFDWGTKKIETQSTKDHHKHHRGLIV